MESCFYAKVRTNFLIRICNVQNLYEFIAAGYFNLHGPKLKRSGNICSII